VINISAVNIVVPNKDIIKKLRDSGLSIKMKPLEDCDFLVIAEHEGKLIGACGIGGLFHVISIQIDDKYQNRGIGIKLLDSTIKESKKRNYSFLLHTTNTKNYNSLKILGFFGISTDFRINYSPGFTRDIGILKLRKRGKIIHNIMKAFNNKISMIILVTFIKIFRRLLFKFILTFNSEDYPAPNIIYAIKNFQKI
jgi:GNAT superfamily N-acetyltransferase